MKSGTVLLVFEDLRDLEICGNLLCGLGYNILMCNSAAEGLKALETEDVSFVILSQDTPAFEGRPVLQRSIQLDPNIPVVIIARVLDRHSFFEAMDLGAIDYLVSPEPHDLAWVIESQIRRSELLDLSVGVANPVDLLPSSNEGDGESQYEPPRNRDVEENF